MNTYVELKERHQKMVDDFPMAFAFNQKQLDEAIEKLGVESVDDLFQLETGGLIAKDSVDDYYDMTNTIHNEFEQAMDNDKTGLGFIYDMFYYELCNHEYNISNDLEYTIDALGLDLEKINSDERFNKGINKAIEDCLRDMQ